MGEWSFTFTITERMNKEKEIAERTRRKETKGTIKKKKKHQTVEGSFYQSRRKNKTSLLSFKFQPRLVKSIEAMPLSHLHVTVRAKTTESKQSLDQPLRPKIHKSWPFYDFRISCNENAAYIMLLKILNLFLFFKIIFLFIFKLF